MATSVARLQQAITKAQAIYSAGASYTKAKATAAQSLLTPQAIAAATAQGGGFGTKLQMASTAATASLAGADANSAAATSTFAAIAATLPTVQGGRSG